MKSDEEQSSPPCVCTHPFPSAWSVAQRESRPVQTSDRMTLTPSSFTAIKLGGGGSLRMRVQDGLRVEVRHELEAEQRKAH